MKIKNINELIEIVKENNELIINLTELNSNDYIKAIYFITGLTHLNGTMIKLKYRTFKIKY